MGLMMKFVGHNTFKVWQLETEDGIYYRTTSGNSWERLYGESWEPVYLTEEDQCKESWKDYLRPKAVNVIRSRSESLVIALVGKDASDWWWNSPNKAFDGQTPKETFDKEPEVVYDYLMNNAM